MKDAVIGNAELTQDLTGFMQQVLNDNPAVPGIVMEIDAPAASFCFSHAVGVANKATGTPLSCDHPARVASNTKTYVAAAILRLWEDGKLDLDAPIKRYLPPDHIATLEQGGYDLEAIKVRHLLTHTSGLFDYSDSDAFNEKVLPGTHCWTRFEQLQGAVAWGQPYGPPGEVFRYTDTGFNELAEIIEQVSGASSYGTAIRDLVGFEKLGIHKTWLEDFEPQPANTLERAHQYLDGASNFDHDPSEDLHGGGGLVATMADLLLFHQALFAGGVYSRPETVQVMLSTVPSKRGGPIAYGREQTPGEYRMGLFVYEIGGALCYLHGGFFGTEAVYIPSLRTTIALTVNMAESKAGARLLDLVVRRLNTEDGLK